jgi:apolipoprotein N-acyltransferase
VVIACCAASAGAHAGLIPSHIRPQPELGVAFVVATVALLAAVAALTIRSDTASATRATALLMTALIGAYALSLTTGIPWIAGESEPVDRIGLATTAIEALSLACAVRLNPATRGHRSPTPQEARP